MSQADTIEAPVRERYDSLARFYNADERRVRSSAL
jgi:hypothetical protein